MELVDCARHGNIECVKQYLQEGVHPDTKNNDFGRTPLVTASTEGYIQIV